MVLLLTVVGVLLVGLLLLLRDTQHDAVHHGGSRRGGSQVHLQPSDLEPNTRGGRWALVALLGAVASELALGTRYVWAMTPLGALAALLALWALTRHQDRSPVTLFVLVVGLFAAFFPLTYVFLERVA